jgi:acyl-CoA synthetase (NDP forming)
VDVAIILVSAGVTPDVVEECCECGVRYIVVESAGFAELGEAGKQIEEQIKKIAEIQSSAVWPLSPASSIPTAAWFSPLES